MTTRSKGTEPAAKRLVYVFSHDGHHEYGPYLDEHPEWAVQGSDRIVVAVPCEVVQPAKPAKTANPAKPAEPVDD